MFSFTFCYVLRARFSDRPPSIPSAAGAPPRPTIPSRALTPSLTPSRRSVRIQWVLRCFSCVTFAFALLHVWRVCRVLRMTWLFWKGNQRVCFSDASLLMNFRKRTLPMIPSWTIMPSLTPFRCLARIQWVFPALHFCFFYLMFEQYVVCRRRNNSFNQGTK